MEWIFEGQWARLGGREREREGGEKPSLCRVYDTWCEYMKIYCMMMDDIKYAVLMHIGAAWKCNDPFFSCFSVSIWDWCV